MAAHDRQTWALVRPSGAFPSRISAPAPAAGVPDRNDKSPKFAVPAGGA